MNDSSTYSEINMYQEQEQEVYADEQMIDFEFDFDNDLETYIDLAMSLNNEESE